ncbi:hypothetical protein TRAPUB_725 [Trametes pubescens]|uniref:Uncharacterized protein n=1 Tax=Trametes pubescens TaxID=154538 RepID=A0A1M2VLF5_TRAPU|nr:hypothetical protein TRAPUB_725 [Trametes pubescens]
MSSCEQYEKCDLTCEYPYVHLVPKPSPILDKLSPREESWFLLQLIRHDDERNTWLADVMGYFRLFSESAYMLGGVAPTPTPVDRSGFKCLLDVPTRNTRDDMCTAHV